MLLTGLVFSSPRRHYLDIISRVKVYDPDTEKVDKLLRYILDPRLTERCALGVSASWLHGLQEGDAGDSGTHQ